MNEGTQPGTQSESPPTRLLWPQVSEPGAPWHSLSVTGAGAIEINVSGFVIVKRLQDWHRCAREVDQLLAWQARACQVLPLVPRRGGSDLALFVNTLLRLEVPPPSAPKPLQEGVKNRGRRG